MFASPNQQFHTQILCGSDILVKIDCLNVDINNVCMYVCTLYSTLAL